MRSNCDCVKEINNQLKTKTGSDDACILSNFMTGCAVIPFYYTPKGKKKETVSNISPSYCPFCGKAYIE